MNWRAETIYADIAPRTNVNVDAKVRLGSLHEDDGTRKRKRRELHRRLSQWISEAEETPVRREESKQAITLKRVKRE